MGIDCRTVRWSIPVSDQHSGTCVQIIYYLTLGVLGAYKLQLFAGLYFYIFDDWTNPEKCLENVRLRCVCLSTSCRFHKHRGSNHFDG